MNADLDVPAPEDFKPAYPDLARLDSDLRCTICTEYFVAPVLLTACSHTFCSEVSSSTSETLCIMWLILCCVQCIRRYLAEPNNKECPTCYVKISEAHIKKCTLVESLAASWAKARPLLLAIIQRDQDNTKRNAAAANGVSSTSKKRKAGASPRGAAGKSKKKAKVDSGSDVEAIDDPTNRSCDASDTVVE